jgi:DNA-directed RNA polymerase specialized sigma24 family protein
MSDRSDFREDRLLIRRCGGGDEDAWKALYDRHAARLLWAVRGQLRRRGLPSHLAEDFVQDVWFALARDKHKRLEHYDAIRAGFQCYLEAIAKQLVQQCCRGRHLRYRRELPLLARDPVDRRGLQAIEQAELAEFLDALSPQQGRFLRERLGEPDPAHAPPLSAGNAWLLKHRLQLKWAKYFNCGGPRPKPSPIASPARNQHAPVRLPVPDRQE